MAHISPDAHNLDVLAHAPRYNASLISDFSAACGRHAPLRCVVDFGAGLGTLTSNLRPLATTVIAIEPELAYHDALQEKCDQILTGLEQLTTRVDAIFTSNVLEHIEDDQGVMRKLFDALKPGGLLFVYVPALPHLFSAMDAAVGHVRRYERLELDRKLRSAGFVIRTVEYRDCLGVPASWYLRVRGAAAAHPSVRAVRFYDKWLFPLSRRADLTGARFFAGKNLMAVCSRPGGADE